MDQYQHRKNTFDMEIYLITIRRLLSCFLKRRTPYLLVSYANKSTAAKNGRIRSRPTLFNLFVISPRTHIDTPTHAYRVQNKLNVMYPEVPAVHSNAQVCQGIHDSIIADDWCPHSHFPAFLGRDMTPLNYLVAHLPRTSPRCQCSISIGWPAG